MMTIQQQRRSRFNRTHCRTNSAVSVPENARVGVWGHLEAKHAEVGTNRGNIGYFNHSSQAGIDAMD